MRFYVLKKHQLQLLAESIPAEVWLHVLSFLTYKERAAARVGFSRVVSDALQLPALVRFVVQAPMHVRSLVLDGMRVCARMACTCTVLHEVLVGRCGAFARAVVQARAEGLRERWVGRRVRMRWAGYDEGGVERWYAGVVLRTSPSGVRLRVRLDTAVGLQRLHVYWAHEHELMYE